MCSRYSNRRSILLNMKKKALDKNISLEEWEEVTNRLIKHPTKTINNVEVDTDLVGLMSTFWERGGRSYASCQGPPAGFESFITEETAEDITYTFDNDNDISCEKPFVIIFNKDLLLFEQAAAETGWKIEQVEEGSGGFMCEWIEDLPPDTELLYIVLSKK